MGETPRTIADDLVAFFSPAVVAGFHGSGAFDDLACSLPAGSSNLRKYHFEDRRDLHPSDFGNQAPWPAILQLRAVLHILCRLVMTRPQVPGMTIGQTCVQRFDVHHYFFLALVRNQEYPVGT